MRFCHLDNSSTSGAGKCSQARLHLSSTIAAGGLCENPTIEPAVERTETDFDPGAKYHIPGNTPYTRYFFSHVMQFQFHRALCDAAGYQGPLHNCSIYNSKPAGEKLGAMLAMGASKPWPEAMEALTGQRHMDADAIIDYFQPLMAWLAEQNAGRQCGW